MTTQPEFVDSYKWQVGNLVIWAIGARCIAAGCTTMPTRAICAERRRSISAQSLDEAAWARTAPGQVNGRPSFLGFAGRRLLVLPYAPNPSAARAEPMSKTEAGSGTGVARKPWLPVASR
jgi:hypothetical protein